MFAIIRNDESVLSIGYPGHGVTWLSIGITYATDWRYAVQFETRLGANKSALMHGATVHTIGEFDNATARHRTTWGGSVERSGAAGKPIPTAHHTRKSATGDRPARVVTPGSAECAHDPGSRRGEPARQPPARPMARARSASDWRARFADTRLEAYGEYERCAL